MSTAWRIALGRRRGGASDRRAGAATSCRSIRRSIRMRSRSGRSRPSRPPRRCGKARSRRMSAAGRSLAGAPPDQIRAIESLGAFVVVRINPQSRAVRPRRRPAPRSRPWPRQAGETGGFVRASLSGDAVPRRLSPSRRSRGRRQAHAFPTARRPARGSEDQGERRVRAEPSRTGSARDADWDAEVIAVDAAELMASATFAVNGWLAPPWVRAGWFHAERLLADADRRPSASTRAASSICSVCAPAISAGWSSASTWSATWSRRSSAAAEAWSPATR